MNQEYVLCIPRATLAGFGVDRGFTPFGDGLSFMREPGPLLNAANTFLPRDEAETDTRFKQIVTYCIIEREPAEPGNPAVFAYRRRGDGESRLRGLVSIGVGGHINAGDCSGLTGYVGVGAGFLRELDEEVILTPPGGSDMQWLGVIDDDSDEVGKVHLGVVLKVRSREPIRPAHGDWDHHRIYNVNSFREPHLFSLCESWTRILLRDLYGVMPAV
jgi:predicted NUDIX family phosphoesterase